MAVKFFLPNFHFSAYYKLSKLTFSKVDILEDVPSDVDMYHRSGRTSHRVVFSLLSSEFFRANFQQGFSGF